MPRPRILITGGSGMLGTAFAPLAQRFDVEVRALGRHELDVRDERAVAGWGKWVEGGWVVHCAALVNVEACAADPSAAYDTIVMGTRHVARLARQCGARLLYPQSFLIYDGQDNPILESAPPRPLSRYGELKLAAERAAVEEAGNPLIVRMGGFFGGEDKDKNFVGRIIPAMHAAIRAGAASFQVGTRVWQPTWTRDLAFNSLHLMASRASGLYHMASRGEASFAEVAEQIVDALNWRRHLTVIPVESSKVAQSELGRRPDRAVLQCDRLSAENCNFQRPWQQALREYLQAPFFDRFRLETDR